MQIVVVKVEETTDGDGWMLSINNGRPVHAISAVAAQEAVAGMGKRLPGTGFSIQWHPITPAGVAIVKSLTCSKKAWANHLKALDEDRAKDAK